MERGLLEQVTLTANEAFNRSNQFLADGVQGRVSNLGKQLLKVVEKQLVFVGQHGQGGVIAHGTHRLVGRNGHWGGEHPQFLGGVAKGALLLNQILALEDLGRRGLGQVVQGDLVFLEPLAVGLAAGKGLLEFLVPDDAALFQADQEHAAGLQATPLQDVLRRNVQHTGLRRHNELVVLGYGVTEGAQAIAVQHCADVLAVGGHDHGGPVPGFHQTGVELVEVFLLLGHGLVLFPCLGNHHQHGVVQAATGHLQQFQRIIETGSVAGAGGHNGRNLLNVVAEQGRLELGLAGVHPVAVAAQGVDFAVVGQVPVRVGQLPVPQGVGAETRVDQGKGADQGLIVQVQVKIGNLVGHEQALVHQGAVGQAANIKIVGVFFADAGGGQAVLDDLAQGVELALQLGGFKLLTTTGNEELAYGGLDRAGIPAQLVGVDGNVAPA